MVMRYLQALVGWAMVGQLFGRPVPYVVLKAGSALGHDAPPELLHALVPGMKLFQSACVPSLSAGLATAYRTDGHSQPFGYPPTVATYVPWSPTGVLAVATTFVLG